MQEYLDRMKKCLILKWYSVRTQKSYVSAVKLYNEFLQKNSSLLGRDSVGKVESYLLFLHRENKAPKTINLSLFAIKFFYKEVLWKSLSKKIYTSKNVKKLPQILSKNEISKIVGVIKNEKHKLILMLAYGSWLRVSEVVKLKVLDIDFERKNIHIKNAKWKKDRVTLLPDKIDIDLKKMIYWKMLYLIPVPVWNMEDITLRALRLFKELKYFLCEDTRETKKLLKRLEIDYSDKDFYSLTSFTHAWRIKHFVNIAKEYDVAVVSDTGTPGLSDPGKKMIEMAHEHVLSYSVLPGANALIPSIVASWFDTSKFVFLGFLPKKKWRKTTFEMIVKFLSLSYKKWDLGGLPVFFYESVHRIKKTLNELREYWFNGKVSITRELSKIHEQLVTANIDDVIEMLEKDEIVLKWEFVVGLY